MKAHFNIKAALMKNLRLHVLLNTPKPHRERINLLHAGASDDVDVIRVLGAHTCSHTARY